MAVALYKKAQIHPAIEQSALAATADYLRTVQDICGGDARQQLESGMGIIDPIGPTNKKTGQGSSSRIRDRHEVYHGKKRKKESYGNGDMDTHCNEELDDNLPVTLPQWQAPVVPTYIDTVADLHSKSVIQDPPIINHPDHGV